MLKVGQRVMVRPNLIVEDLRDVLPNFSRVMDKTLGKIGTIVDVSHLTCAIQFDDDTVNRTVNRKEVHYPCFWRYHISWISLLDERKNEVMIMEED